MKKLFTLLLLSLLASPGGAQENDLADERARLANQRIEAEARAREEQERQARLAAERAEGKTSPTPAPPPGGESRGVESDAAAPPASIAPAAAPRASATSQGELDRLLEQIRTLGELRDAGYVTDQEFERIKTRILDGTL